MPVPYIEPVLNMLGAITAKGLRRTCDTHYSISLLWKTKYLAVKKYKEQFAKSTTVACHQIINIFFQFLF